MRITKKNGITTIADILVSLFTSVLSALSLLVFHYFNLLLSASSRETEKRLLPPSFIT